MSLKDFYRATSKKFDVIITKNGVTPDITTDAVTFYMSLLKEDTDAEMTLTASADISSSGGSGIASFDLTPTMTDVTADTYEYEIIWDLSTGQRYVLDQSIVNVKETIKD